MDRERNGRWTSGLARRSPRESSSGSVFPADGSLMKRKWWVRLDPQRLAIRGQKGNELFSSVGQGGLPPHVLSWKLIPLKSQKTLPSEKDPGLPPCQGAGNSLLITLRGEVGEVYPFRSSVPCGEGLRRVEGARKVPCWRDYPIRSFKRGNRNR